MKSSMNMLVLIVLSTLEIQSCTSVAQVLTVTYVHIQFTGLLNAMRDGSQPHIQNSEQKIFMYPSE